MSLITGKPSIPLAIRSPGRRAPLAFSLIELMVAIGIIAVLVGILLPTLSRAKATQRRATCLSNLHQLATAFTLYAQDHDGLGPDAYSEDTWDALIWPYLKVEAVYHCPDDIDDYSEGFGTSYEWRDLFAVAQDKPEAALSGRDLLSARPSSLVLVFDAVPEWHAPGMINTVQIDGAALSMTIEDFNANLDQLVE